MATYKLSTQTTLTNICAKTVNFKERNQSIC